MNKVIMMGRLTKDPEIRTAGNTTVGKYSLAVDRKFKKDGEPDADFFNCTVFGKGAEFAEKYLKKGTKIVISGEVRNNNYTDKNGNKVYSTEILVNEQEFAESKKSNDEQSTDFMPVPDEMELPFN